MRACPVNSSGHSWRCPRKVGGRLAVASRYGRGVEADEALAQGVADEVGAVLGVELGHDVGAVRLDGLDADVELLGDLLVGGALGDELEHLALAGGEEVVADAAGVALQLPEVVGEVAVADAGAEVGVAAMDGLDAEQELVYLRLLDDVAVGAGLQGAGDVLVLHVAGEHEDFGLGQAAADLTRRLDAVEAGHDRVHEDDVGLDLLGDLDGLAAVGGLADDLEAGLGLEHVAERLADDGGGVGDEDAGG